MTIGRERPGQELTSIGRMTIEAVQRENAPCSLYCSARQCTPLSQVNTRELNMPKPTSHAVRKEPRSELRGLRGGSSWLARIPASSPALSAHSTQLTRALPLAEYRLYCCTYLPDSNRRRNRAAVARTTSPSTRSLARQSRIGCRRLAPSLRLDGDDDHDGNSNQPRRETSLGHAAESGDQRNDVRAFDGLAQRASSTRAATAQGRRDKVVPARIPAKATRELTPHTPTCLCRERERSRSRRRLRCRPFLALPAARDPTFMFNLSFGALSPCLLPRLRTTVLRRLERQESRGRARSKGTASPRYVLPFPNFPCSVNAFSARSTLSVEVADLVLMPFTAVDLRSGTLYCAGCQEYVRNDPIERFMSAERIALLDAAQIPADGHRG